MESSQLADKRARRSRRFAIALFAALALFATACGGDDDETATPTVEATVAAEPTEAPEEPTAEPTAEPTPEPAPTEVPAEPTPEPTEVPEIDESQLPLAAETIDWAPCGLLQCSMVEVPVDYDDPSAGTLQIAVNVLRSTDLDARIGYLFVNPGGPGGSGMDYVTVLSTTAPQELLDSFDLIGFDPRGVAASEPSFSCGDGNEWVAALREIEDYADTESEIEIGNSVAARCVDAMGPAALQLGTDEVARDMDEIRAALGTEQISYLGVSYGSTVGPWYASLFPERVYSMVIDGAGNPMLRLNDTLEKVRRLQDSTYGPWEENLERIIASCDEECPMWNDGDPTAYWYEHAPKIAGLSDGELGPPGAIIGLVGYQYNEASWPQLHNAMVLLGEQGDLSGFDTALEIATLGAPPGQNITGHVNCLDTWALFPDRDPHAEVLLSVENTDVLVQEFQDQYPLVYAALADAPPPIDACQFFGNLEPPTLDGALDGGGQPILVVGNRTDPITSFVQSEQYANEVLADGRLVVTDHFKHGVYGENDCIDELVHAALLNQDFPEEVIECPEQEPVPLGFDDVVLVETPLTDGGTAVTPEGWEVIAPDVLTSPDGNALLVHGPSGGSVESGVQGAEAQLGGVAEPQGEIEMNGVTWSLFEMEIDDEVPLVARFAVGPGEDGYVILGLTTPEAIDSLSASVLFPALEGYVPAG